MKAIVPLSAVLLLLAGCGSPSTSETADVVVDAASAAGGPERLNVCLWNELGVRETASEKGKYLTTIYLGERVALTGDSATEASGNKTNLFYKITMSDGTSGWVNSTFLAKGAVPAAVVAPTNLYKRPDAATVTDVRLNLVEYVVAWPMENGWAKVKTKRTGDKWFVEGYVEERNLLYDKAEADFAALAKRVAETEKDAIKQALIGQLSNQAFQATQMYSIYYAADEEVEEVSDEPAFSGTVVEPMPDLNTASGQIISLFGRSGDTPSGNSEFWYVYNGERYRLQEISTDIILSTGANIYVCTVEQLNQFPVNQKVLNYIPEPGSTVQ